MSVSGDDNDIAVTLRSRAWRSALPDARDVVREACMTALGAPELNGWKRGVSVSIQLAGNRWVRRLNAQYRHQDKPTNVLSFPAHDSLKTGIAQAVATGDMLELGDVILALETCRDEAQVQGKILADHVRHLVVHGVLHLLGYDHENDREAQAMERLETRLLKRLGVGDPYGYDG